MKKLLVVLAVAGFATACNNDAETKEEKKDSVVNTIDSTGEAKKDSVVDKIDSTTNAKKDSVSKM
jgi:hypothetical protein